MDDTAPYSESYELGKIVAIGAAAASGLVFSLVILLFLASQISYHPSSNTDTITEMMGYTEFFVFAVISYFGAAVLSWIFRATLANHIVAWLPISFFGSVVFCFAFLFRVWISDPASGSFLGFAKFSSVASLAIFLITGTFAAIGSVIYSAWKVKTDLKLN